ncbi:hypothetical protein, partial [Pseudomonas sp. YuFO8]|uniref:hypothetical protein n=1 Tax=Pseudomonas sp. YuFO8 TaxID=3095361 RepID=UPI002B24F7D6
DFELNGILAHWNTPKVRIGVQLLGGSSNCRSWLASEGGLTAEQSPADIRRSNCRSWLASEGGLTAE